MAAAVAPSISSSLSSQEYLPATRTLPLQPIAPAGNAKAPFHAGEVLTWKDKYIYSTSKDPATASYHLSTRNTRQGNPWQMQISHLLPSESRRLSLASPADEDAPFIRYDDDLTLYTGEKVTIPFSIGSKPLLVLRGRRRGTVQGSIVLEKAGSRVFKFWHMQPIKHALTKENIERIQALMQKRGYKSSDDWKKELLFSVQLVKRSKTVEEVEWTDDLGAVVAIERDGLIIVGEELNMDKKDLIVSCWACKTFVMAKPAAGGSAAEGVEE